MRMCFTLPILLVGLLVSACSQPTKYQTFSSQGEQENTILDQPTVQYRLDPQFYKSAPNCVIILESNTKSYPEAKQHIDEITEMHLGTKIPNVIGARKRIRLERELGFDLSNKKDRKQWSETGRCGYFAKTEIFNDGSVFGIVWSSKRIFINTKILSGTNDQILWEASHQISRSDGGVPLSPFSAVMSVVRAGNFERNKDILFEMMHLALSRMVATIPDIR